MQYTPKNRFSKLFITIILHNFDIIIFKYYLHGLLIIFRHFVMIIFMKTLYYYEFFILLRRKNYGKTTFEN